MNYRSFGTTDLKPSEIGFGCARLGGVFGNLTRSAMLGTLHQAYAEGINFFDTSDMYCQGESEKLVGEAFHDRRDQVIIASKVGYVLPGRRKLIAKIKPVLRPIVRRLGLKRENLPISVRGELSQDFSPAYITRAVEQSLTRLKTDYLDLYQLHSPPSSVLEQGEAIETLDKLKTQGKIRYYGVSCETTEDALICLRYPGLSSLQLRLSLLDQSALETVIPQAAGKGLGIIARECFAGGLLAKQIVNLKSSDISDDSEKSKKLQKQMHQYSEVARQSNRTLPQMALYFILDQPAVSLALLGMTTDTHLKSNLALLAAKTTS